MFTLKKYAYFCSSVRNLVADHTFMDVKGCRIQHLCRPTTVMAVYLTALCTWAVGFPTML